MNLHGTQQGPLRSILLKEMKAFFSFKELTIMCRKSDSIIELRVYIDPTIKSPNIFWNRSFMFPSDHSQEAVSACKGLLALGASYDPIALASE